jgi:hypothetical protein
MKEIRILKKFIDRVFDSYEIYAPNGNIYCLGKDKKNEKYVVGNVPILKGCRYDNVVNFLKSIHNKYKYGDLKDYKLVYEAYHVYTSANVEGECKVYTSANVEGECKVYEGE